MGRRFHSPVSLAGWPLFLAAIVLAAIGAQFSAYLAWPFLALLCLLLYLFRDPWRTVPADPLAVVAPVDGRVIDIVRVNNPLTDHFDRRISLQIAKTGAYVVHSAVEGNIMTLRRNGPDTEHRGHYITALSIKVCTDEGDDVVTVVHRGYLGHYPRCYHRPGERVGQGRRLSYVPFGTQLDIYVPDTSRIEVAPGDTLVAGESILAHFVH